MMEIRKFFYTGGPLADPRYEEKEQKGRSWEIVQKITCKEYTLDWLQSKVFLVLLTINSSDKEAHWLLWSKWHFHLSMIPWEHIKSSLISADCSFSETRQITGTEHDNQSATVGSSTPNSDGRFSKKENDLIRFDSVPQTSRFDSIWFDSLQARN